MLRKGKADKLLGDRLVAPICSEAIHLKWNLELRGRIGAGHDLTLDDGV